MTILTLCLGVTLKKTAADRTTLCRSVGDSRSISVPEMADPRALCAQKPAVTLLIDWRLAYNRNWTCAKIIFNELIIYAFLKTNNSIKALWKGRFTLDTLYLSIGTETAGTRRRRIIPKFIVTKKAKGCNGHCAWAELGRSEICRAMAKAVSLASPVSINVLNVFREWGTETSSQSGLSGSLGYHRARCSGPSSS